MRSAENVVSSAASIVGYQSRQGTQNDSDNGESWSEERSGGVEQWNVGIVRATNEMRQISEAEEASINDLNSQSTADGQSYPPLSSAPASPSTEFIQNLFDSYDPLKVDLAGLDKPIADLPVEWLAMSYLEDKKWADAKSSLHHLLNYETDENVRWQRMHMLAEACLGATEFAEAENWCLAALQGRQASMGIRHEQFYESVNLLVQIYKIMGKQVNAHEHAVLHQLPPGLEGKNSSRVVINQRVHCDRAAVQSRGRSCCRTSWENVLQTYSVR